MSGHQAKNSTRALAFGTLGIVYGDIGTSPIYAFRESFERAELDVTMTNAYGVASLVFWSLAIVISLKYLALVMRADNRGEGGILALTALVGRTGGRARLTAGVITLGVFGTALLYGDGLITPAISVLSAVEGFEVATDAFSRWVIPLAVVILVGLFLVQRRGTANIARAFGPVMLVWFTTLAVLGLRQIMAHPGVLKAVSPTYAIEFFIDHPWRAFLALGSVFLVVTGGEARLLPPPAHSAHLGQPYRPGVRTARQLDADDRLCRPGTRVPELVQPGLGLRHRRHDDHAHHHVAVLPSGP
jgi:KUP system potassium uptake protein